MLENEKAAVDVGASAAARQSKTSLCCAFPLQRPAPESDSIPAGAPCQPEKPRTTRDFYVRSEAGNDALKNPRFEKRVTPLLGRGAENALQTAELMDALGLRDRRQLRLLIERERAEGALILSTVKGRGGYFLPSADPFRAREEIAAFIKTVHSRAVNSQRALRAARRALRQCAGQLEINDRGGEKHGPKRI